MITLPVGDLKKKKKLGFPCILIIAINKPNLHKNIFTDKHVNHYTGRNMAIVIKLLLLLFVRFRLLISSVGLHS